MFTNFPFEMKIGIHLSATIVSFTRKHFNETRRRRKSIDIRLVRIALLRLSASLSTGIMIDALHQIDMRRRGNAG